MYKYILNEIDENRTIIQTINFTEMNKVNERYFNIIFENMPSFVNYAMFNIIIMENDNIISNEEFILSEDDFDIHSPNIDNSKFDLVQCQNIDNMIILDFEVLFLKEGLYKVDGSFIPFLECSFEIAKQAINAKHLEIAYINKYCKAYIDEEGSLINKEINNTFPNFVGDIFIIRNQS